MDDDRLERLRRVAATMKMSKAEIIEAAIDVRLDMLEGYVKLDTAPPKTVPLALARKVKGGTLKLEPGGVNYVEPDPILADLKMKPGKLKDAAPRAPSPARSVRGYAFDGSPIYR